MAFSRRGAAHLLAHAPTSLFPIALGLAGVGAALRAAGPVHDAASPGTVGSSMIIAAAVVLSVDVLVYAAKLLRSRVEVADDLAEAERANLLAPGFMAGVVIAGVLATVSPLGGSPWLAITLGHAAMLVHFVGRWFARDYDSAALSPTWFLPAAGIMTAAGTWPGYGPRAVPLFVLAAGAALWLTLLPLVFRRLVFEPPLAPRLRPTLFIVAAPFGLLANGLVTMAPGLEPVIPAVIACGGLFFLLVLLTRLRVLTAAGVSLSWWATTFPCATVAAAFLRLAPELGAPALYAGTAVLVLSCVTTLLAVAATFVAAGRTCKNTVAETRVDVAAMQGVDRVAE